MVQAFAREVSDHTPLFIDSGEHNKNGPIFRYENHWNMREMFREFVYKVWNEAYKGNTLERWQARCRNLRKKTKGWNKNVDASYKKIKTEIIKRLDDVDKVDERQGLIACDRKEQKDLREQLNRLLKQEEVKWFQRYKDKEIKEGDSNTRYYHAKVNGRRRK